MDFSSVPDEWRCLQGYFSASKPRVSAAPRFSLILRNIINQLYSITPPQVFSSASSKGRKMSQYTINDSNCINNTNSFNVLNICAIVDDRAQLLTWLSPLEPRLRHRDVQERRVDSVGEWVIQTEEFRSWYDCSGEGEGDKAVLLCYGDPGVGKTFIR